MKFFTTDKIRLADAYTISNEPVASIDLMERAALQLTQWITSRYQPGDSFKIFAGPGNNGGDAWALARLLLENRYQNTAVYLLNISDKLSPDSEINRKRFNDLAPRKIHRISSKNDFPEISKEDIIVDGLFGSGLSRPLEGLAAELVQFLNASTPKKLIAIDIPSGLFGEDNSANERDKIVRADITLTFQFPKLSFFFAENGIFVGDWFVLPIGLHADFINAEKTPYNYILEEDISPLLHKRDRFSHKGTYGHALLIAGSYGMMGAVVLASRAAIRGGAGLLTAHVPRKGVEIMQTAVPESLISVDESDIIFTSPPDLDKFSAIGIGPGLNQKPDSKKGLLNLLQKVKVPCVIDADALNMLSTIKNWTDMIPGNAILTPHPKEFERLAGKYSDSFGRLKEQAGISTQYRCTIILKGAFTCITTPEGEIWFNTTGNPGMAKGGSGDVLTGLILGLLAQGYSPTAASILGVFLHGFAGDMAAKTMGEHGLIPSDIVRNIGKAFNVFEKTF